MASKVPNWPTCTVSHSWGILNENDKTKCYRAGISTMVGDQLFLTKWESLISEPDAVAHAFQEMFDKVKYNGL